ncbi:MAG TPA: hypothetical protein VF101_15495 [Gaiellaceae bacterium]
MTRIDDPLRERLHRAVSWDDDRDWRDVRRRARRQRAPAVLAAALVLVVVVAGPAFAFRHQIADWWSSASPETNHFVDAFAECGRGAFTLTFDPESGATVQRQGQTLAGASFRDRQISCDATIHLRKGTPDELNVYHGVLDRSSGNGTSVTCSTDTPLEIEVHPVWFENEIVGSGLTVAEAGTRTDIAGVLMKRGETGRNWSRVYWSSDVCSTSP